MTKMQTVLTSDYFDFIIVALNNASLEIKKKQGVKQEEMYDRIEVELRGVQKVVQSSCHWENQSWEMSQPNSTD